MTYSAMEVVERMNLMAPGEVHSLPRRAQTLRVVSGDAWVTFDGEDYCVNSGQEIRLAPGRQPAVVMALGGIPLVYEIT